MILKCYIFLCVFVFAFTVKANEQKLNFFRFKGLYSQGVSNCKKLLSKKENGIKRIDILFELAACYQFNTRENMKSKAIDIYNKILKEYPNNSNISKAKIYFYIARCNDIFSRDRDATIEKARDFYNRCYTNYPQSTWAEKAFFWNANSYIYVLNRENAEIATKLFEKFLTIYPNSLLKPIVHSQLSELYCTWLDDYPNAVKHSERVMAFGIQDVTLERLHVYRLAYLYQFKIKNNKKAIKWYKVLIKNSPTKADPNFFIAISRIEKLSNNN